MLRRSKCTAALLATALAFGLAACGGDDEDDAGTTSATTTGEQRTAAETGGETATTPTETSATDTAPSGGEAEGGGAKPPSPEEQEGGAGDEIPASSQALITGSGGELTPKTVRVPPFIAIRVQLRSADGVEYELSGGGKTIEAGGEIETAGTTFDGLRTGERLVLSGPQGRITVIANAEPGP